VKLGGDVQVRRAVEKWKETNDIRDMDKVLALTLLTMILSNLPSRLWARHQTLTETR